MVFKNSISGKVLMYIYFVTVLRCLASLFGVFITAFVTIKIFHPKKDSAVYSSGQGFEPMWLLTPDLVAISFSNATLHWAMPHRTEHCHAALSNATPHWAMSLASMSTLNKYIKKSPTHYWAMYNWTHTWAMLHLMQASFNSLKGAQAWEFFARVFYTKWTLLGMWLRDKEKNWFFIAWPFISMVFFTACWVGAKPKYQPNTLYKWIFCLNPQVTYPSGIAQCHEYLKLGYL